MNGFGGVLFYSVVFLSAQRILSTPIFTEQFRNKKELVIIVYIY